VRRRKRAFSTQSLHGSASVARRLSRSTAPLPPCRTIAVFSANGPLMHQLRLKMRCWRISAGLDRATRTPRRGLMVAPGGADDSAALRGVLRAAGPRSATVADPPPVGSGRESADCEAPEARLPTRSCRGRTGPIVLPPTTCPRFVAAEDSRARLTLSCSFYSTTR
jgi:hypothetical protein